MKIPLVFDEKNPKYRLLSSIFIIIDSPGTKQVLSQNGLKPNNSIINLIKIRFISMFFNINIKYAVDEVNNSSELRKQWGFKYKLNYNKLSKLLSEFDSDQIREFVLKLINKQFLPGKRGRRTVIIDATSIKLDINLNKKYYSKEELEEKNFKIGFSKTHGYFIGGKLTLAMDFHTGKPLAMLIHRGAYPDMKIFLEMVEELKRRRIITKKDIIMADKGFVSYDNYEIGVLNYKIIPLIFPRENMRINKILSRFNYPLEVYKGNIKLKKILKDIVSTFTIFIKHWKLFKPIRSFIEHFFKLMKKGIGYSTYHVYTEESMKKTVYLNVLLTTLTIKEVTFNIKTIQQLSEM
jgi:transposase